ncbi:hypothetical protein BAE44_0006743 [Dichanthelium oligosanthes]|uniref:Neprosin domain-containing protein n=1 Tax=Dichanthelium oligosanthes TaxID=888268 RepID=A0A1E5W4R7_9POAL|nr:hypothetical protein BAE44_0006743 [Dichanthelium oligosanthes]
MGGRVLNTRPGAIHTTTPISSTTTPRCYGVNPLGCDKSSGGFDVVYGGPGGIYCDK